MFWALTVLGGSLLSEGATLLMALRATREGAQRAGQSLVEHVVSGADPSVNVVLLEDTAAVVGVGVALSCIGGCGDGVVEFVSAGRVWWCGCVGVVMVVL